MRAGWPETKVWLGVALVTVVIARRSVFNGMVITIRSLDWTIATGLLVFYVTWPHAWISKAVYKAMVRPIIEYANTIWGPHFLLDKRRLERVQHCTTKMIPSLSDKSYHHHLISLDLPSLNHRRIRDDLIFLYKLIAKWIFQFTFFTLSPTFIPEEIHWNFTKLIPTAYVDQTIFL